MELPIPGRRLKPGRYVKIEPAACFAFRVIQLPVTQMRAQLDLVQDIRMYMSIQSTRKKKKKGKKDGESKNGFRIGTSLYLGSSVFYPLPGLENLTRPTVKTRRVSKYRPFKSKIMDPFFSFFFFSLKIPYCLLFSFLILRYRDGRIERKISTPSRSLRFSPRIFSKRNEMV